MAPQADLAKSSRYRDINDFLDDLLYELLEAPVGDECVMPATYVEPEEYSASPVAVRKSEVTFNNVTVITASLGFVTSDGWDPPTHTAVRGVEVAVLDADGDPVFREVECWDIQNGPEDSSVEDAFVRARDFAADVDVDRDDVRSAMSSGFVAAMQAAYAEGYGIHLDNSAARAHVFGDVDQPWWDIEPSDREIAVALSLHTNP